MTSTLVTEPVAEPVFAPVLIRKLMAQADEEGEREIAFGARIRHSWAGSCARLLGYRLIGVPPTEEIDPASRWSFALGQLIHEWFQAALVEQYPDAVEIEVSFRNPDVDASCHLDALVTVEAPDAE